MAMVVTLENRDGIALILINNPPVNATSHAVRDGLAQAVARAQADAAVDAMVIACAGSTFIAGADVREFGTPPREPLLPSLVQTIENAAKPVVAALHGTVLGGGLEVALAAHARIALHSTALGLPEVKLGLVPGAGGTQRLPRLAGMKAAIDLASSGRRMGAAEALASGIVDRVVESDVVAVALAHARTLVGKPLRRTGQLPVPSFDQEAVAAQIAAIDKKARGQIAPVQAARLVRAAADLPLAEGLAQERAAFLTLLESDQSRALRYVFAAERLAGKLPELQSEPVRPVARTGVVGAGLMGAGIAVTLADAGYQVTVVDIDQAGIAAGRARIEAIYERSIRSGRLDAAGRDARMGRMQFSTDRAALADCDLVIEAVFDELSVKQELFAALGGIVRPDTILATNTSYLNPDALAAVVPEPGRVIGLHFFSPANIMRLVEVVRTCAISPDVLATGLAVVKRLGKLGVVSGVCEGFIGNRLFTAWRRACDAMLEDGALPHEIDAALEGFGFAMGPYAVNDLAGLDISWARRKRSAATRDPALRYVVIADRLCEAGRFGQKTGKGYYLYDNGRKLVDPVVTELIEAVSRERGIARRRFEAAEIVQCVMDAIVAEGRMILQEGIALRASDIDLVLINGYGYPAWRGGPMFLAGLAGA